MKYAVVCGSLNMDIVCSGPRIPSPGETIIGREYNTHIGGKGCNQAVALAKMGIETYMIGCVGKDDYGKRIIDVLLDNNVGINHINEVNVNTGTAHIMVEDGGENNIVVIPGANFYLNTDMVLEAKERIVGASVLLTQLEIPLDSVIEFLGMGREYGIKTVLNPAPIPPEGLPDELLSLVDLMTPNQSEMKFLTGIDVMDESSFIKAAEMLHKKGVKEVVCTMGSKGACYSGHNRICRQDAFLVDPVDTTCAGDSFNGALLAKLLEGNDIPDALKFASYVASVTVTKPGAQESIPLIRDIGNAISL